MSTRWRSDGGSHPVGRVRAGAGRSVAAVGGSPSVAVTGPLCHAVADLGAAVLELEGDQASSNGDRGALFVGFLLLVGEGEAGALGAGVDAQLHSVGLRLGMCAVFQPDGEGDLPGDHGPSLAKEFAGAGGVAGREGFSVPGEDEDPAGADATGVRPVVRGSVTAPVLCRLRRRGGVLGVTPTGCGALPVGLPSPMFPAGAPREGGESVSRFVPAPRGVCSHGFQSRLLRKHSLVGLLTYRKRSHRAHLPDLEDRDDWGWSLSDCPRAVQSPALGRGAGDLPPEGRHRR